MIDLPPIVIEMSGDPEAVWLTKFAERGIGHAMWLRNAFRMMESTDDETPEPVIAGYIHMLKARGGSLASPEDDIATALTNLSILSQYRRLDQVTDRQQRFTLIVDMVFGFITTDGGILRDRYKTFDKVASSEFVGRIAKRAQYDRHQINKVLLEVEKKCTVELNVALGKRDQARSRIAHLQEQMDAIAAVENLVGGPSIRHQAPQAAYRAMEVAFPHVLKVSYPRSYQCPARYCSPKALALFCMLALNRANNGFSVSVEKLKKSASLSPDIRGLIDHIADTGATVVCDTGAASGYETISGLTRSAVPTYFIDPHILTDLMATDLPADMSMLDLEWPMDSMLFMLPEGALVTDSGDATMLAIHRMRKGQPIIPIGGRLNFMCESVHAKLPTTVSALDALCCVMFTDKLHYRHALIHIDETPLSSCTDRANNRPEFEGTSISVEESMPGVPEFDADGVVIKNACVLTTTVDMSATVRLALTLLLSMNAEPEIIERMVLARPPNPKAIRSSSHGGTWHPNWIGKSYGERRRAQLKCSGGHASPHAHWRRGHYRSVFRMMGDSQVTVDHLNQRVHWVGDQRYGFHLHSIDGDQAQVRLPSDDGQPVEIPGRGAVMCEIKSIPLTDLRLSQRAVKWIRRKLVNAHD
jgi:hypothetical protein